MNYKLLYHPDGFVFRNVNGTPVGIPFDAFVKANPHIPLKQGEFFEYNDTGFIRIDSNGAGNFVNIAGYKQLVDAINTKKAPNVNHLFPVNTIVEEYIELDGIQLTAKTDEGVAIGFKIVNGVQVWEYRDFTEQELTERTNAEIIADIVILESQKTLRRITEAVLGTDNGWLENLENQISELRAQIIK